ncbi:alkaline phosphatase D family protein [Glycomyces paridis]|uniref:PhoD-like phosphatase metallophosphatase domain-containing protein n=1 Tax=Glycomyces paridis TaxID=2126555 RepID=A0A4S8PCA3_9ACTN|nr:alkaline phosphatase D family protein [Glycomyces paridis]THV27947.1 hypothetical protein E9998_13230 [Glycomyces paridis]
MTIVNLLPGNASPTGGTVAVRATTGSVRLLVADNQAMTGGVYTGSVARDAGGCAQVPITGLEPYTRYWFQAEDGSGLGAAKGSFFTHPPLGEPASYTAAVAGDVGLSPRYPGVAGGELDAARVSNTDLYDHMHLRSIFEDWLMFVDPGDWGYPDWGTRNTDTIANRRRFRDDLLAQPKAGQFYANHAYLGTWGDHNFAANNSDGTYVNKALAAQEWRERIPSGPLAEATGPIYHDRQIARTLWMVSDDRYHRSPNGATDNASKTMLGSGQKAWMAARLAAAASDDSIGALVWVMGSQWMNPTHADGWASFLTERAELVEMFGDTGWIGNMVIVSADAHDCAIFSPDAVASNGMAAHVPVFHFAAIDATPIYGGPSDVGLASGMSLANNFRGRGQFGTLRIDDKGGDLSIAGTAWRRDTVLNRFQFTTGGASLALPAGTPGTVLAL